MAQLCSWPDPCVVYAAGLKGFHVVFCLQNFGSMLGSIPIALSTVIVMKVPCRVLQCLSNQCVRAQPGQKQLLTCTAPCGQAGNPA